LECAPCSGWPSATAGSHESRSSARLCRGEPSRMVWRQSACGSRRTSSGVYNGALTLYVPLTLHRRPAPLRRRERGCRGDGKDWHRSGSVTVVLSLGRRAARVRRQKKTRVAGKRSNHACTTPNDAPNRPRCPHCAGPHPALAPPPSGKLGGALAQLPARFSHRAENVAGGGGGRGRTGYRSSGPDGAP